MSSLIYQFNKKLKSMQKYGNNKHEAKKVVKEVNELFEKNANTNAANGIFSKITFKNYQNNVMLFAKYIQAEHKEIKNIHQITTQIAHEYLEKLQDEDHYKAATIQTKSAAIAKVLDFRCEDINYNLNKKRSELPSKGRNIRNNTLANKHNNLIDFFKNTGCRRSEAMQITPQQIKTDTSGNIFLDFRSEREYQKMTKGGRGRFITQISEKYQQVLLKIKETAEKNNYTRIWQNVSNSTFQHFNSHAYRREFAQNLYKSLEQEYIDEHGYTAKHDYVCRKYDESYNREFLKIVSEELGHNRVDVVIDNYFR